jgi:hypothetical protein
MMQRSTMRYRSDWWRSAMGPRQQGADIERRRLLGWRHPARRF